MIRGLMLLMVIAAMTAAAGAGQPECGVITDDQQRLACYDRPVTQPGGEPQLGDESLPKPKIKQPRQLQAHVVGRVIGWRKGTRFKLDNGQIWQSIDGDNDTDDVDFLDPAVTIQRNFIGHYWMSFGRSAPEVLVKRLR